jgi:hypothetical protein
MASEQGGTIPMPPKDLCRVYRSHQLGNPVVFVHNVRALGVLVTRWAVDGTPLPP